VTVGLSELKQTIVAVRHVSRLLDIPWGSDPLLYQTALPGYQTSKSLQALDYTPGRDDDPYFITELQDDRLMRQIVRKGIGHQYDMGAGLALGAAFLVRTADDPMLTVSARALELSINSRNAFGPRPLIAPVHVDLRGFMHPQDQAVLVRGLSQHRPDAFLVHLSGLHEDATEAQIVAAIRLVLALQSVGAPVILARAGDLRHVALAAGVRGVEIGLGRLLRFSIPDYSKDAGGPGPVPPRFELPSLVLSFNEAATHAAFDSGVAELDCACASCVARASRAARMNHGDEHNLHAVVDGAGGLGALAPTVRCQQLDGRLARASWLLNGIDHKDAVSAQKRQRKWRAALEQLDQRGLLLPDAAAEALGLTG
jgi:hypothetical protein